MVTTQSWIVGTSGDWSTAAGWVSGAVPTSTEDAVINNSNAVTVDGTAVAHSLALDSSTLTLSGTLTLGTSLTVDGGSEIFMSGGSLSAQSIVTDNSGYILGYGTVGGDVIGDGFIIGPSGGTLEFEGLLAGSVVYGYPYTPSTLKLDQPAEFTGSLNYISVGDTLDLVGITANSGVYNGSTLTINETDGQHLVYNVFNASVAGDTLNVVAGTNQTEVYWSQPTESWIVGTSGDWSTAAGWVSGAVPTSTEDAVISSSMAVTVNGTAVANLLTLDASILTLSGTLTLGTALTVDDGAQLPLIGGTLSAQSISSNNNGSLSGYGTVGGAVSGDVNITATGGTLTVQGSLAGDRGVLDIGGRVTGAVSA